MNKKSIDTLKSIIREVVEEVIEDNMEALYTSIKEDIEKVKIQNNKTITESTPSYRKNFTKKVSQINEHQVRSSNNKPSKPTANSLLSVLNDTKPFMSHEK